MSRFYRKPKPETMRKNREIAKQQFAGEMSWLKENVSKLTQNKHKFLIARSRKSSGKFIGLKYAGLLQIVVKLLFALTLLYLSSISCRKKCKSGKLKTL